MSAHFQCVRLQVGVYLCVWHFCAPPFKMRGFMFWNSTVRNLGLMEQLDAILNSRRMPISPYVSVDTKRVIYDIVLGNDDTGWRLCSYTGLLVFMPEVISIHTMFSCTENPEKNMHVFCSFVFLLTNRSVFLRSTALVWICCFWMSFCESCQEQSGWNNSFTIPNYLKFHS